MAINSQITDGEGTGKQARVSAKDVAGKARNALNVFTHPLEDRVVGFDFATNPSFGNELAQNAAFGGTPVGVHDGTDSVLWTFSQIAGTKVTEDSTDQAQAGTKSVKVNKPNLNDIWQFDRGSDLTISSYTGITMFIYIDSDWSTLDSVSMYAWDTGTATQVGDKVFLEDVLDLNTVGSWQSIAILFTSMGISTGTFDALRFEYEAKSGQSPTFYMDEIQVEETSGALTYTIAPLPNQILNVENLGMTIADGLTGNYPNNISYDKFLNETALTNGIVVTAVQDGVISFAITVRRIFDLVQSGSIDVTGGSDGTNTFVKYAALFRAPIILDSRTDDKISVTISDDLSGLLSLSLFADGYAVELE
jgi:hypothetical protein